jgi:acyl-CoA synthetase (AMP-forming)/AMP-acid ligase II
VSASPFITAIRRHAAERPPAPALTCGESRLDWAGFAASVEQAAAAFQRHGVSPGERVAIVAAPSLAYVVLFFGGVAAGACMVPMPNKSGARTLERLIADCGPRILIVDAAASEILADCRPDGAPVIALDAGAVGAISLDDFLAGAGYVAGPRSSGDAPFNIIYSSGTTGTPKGIVHSSNMRLRQASRDTFMLGADSVMLLATPPYSNTTLLPLLATVLHGGHTVLMPKFDAEAYLRVAEAVRATHTMLVPVQYQRIVAHPRFDATDLSAFVLKQCTGAPLPVEVKRALITRWPGRFLEVYGLTEGGCTVILDATAHPDKLATVGRPAPGTDIRIIDQRGNELPKGATGEIVGRSGLMMTGYFGRPEDTEALLWRDREGNVFFRSGDLGAFDEDGFLKIAGRKKDVVISGGFNVYASDLESVLLQHPAIREAAVIGIPSEAWGETPWAVLVLHDGRSADADEIRDWANARLDRMQRLAGVEIRPALPRSDIGKILKQELRAAYWTPASMGMERQ